MSKAEILEELPKLTMEERREIVRRISELDDHWLDDGELTAEEKALIAQRVDDFEKHPEQSIAWAEAESQLIKRFGISR